MIIDLKHQDYSGKEIRTLAQTISNLDEEFRNVSATEKITLSSRSVRIFASSRDTPRTPMGTIRQISTLDYMQESEAILREVESRSDQRRRARYNNVQMSLPCLGAQVCAPSGVSVEDEDW